MYWSRLVQHVQFGWASNPKSEPAFFLPVMSLHPLMENVPFASLVDVNRKGSGGDFLEEVCFCNHQSSCYDAEVYPGCQIISEIQNKNVPSQLVFLRVCFWSFVHDRFFS